MREKTLSVYRSPWQDPLTGNYFYYTDDGKMRTVSAVALREFPLIGYPPYFGSVVDES